MDRWIGEVKVYTRFTKCLHQTAFSPKLLVLQLKFAPFPSSTLSLTISSTHTQNKWKFTYSLQAKQNTHLTSKAAIWFSWKIQHTRTQTNWNWAQFQKAQLIPYKTRYAFSCSPPGQGSYVHKLSLPLEWSQVTHIPTRTSRKITFLQCLCQTTVWWCLSSRMPLCLSSTLTNI